MILACVLLTAEEQSLSNVASVADVPLTTVQREVDRLAEAGVFITRKRGNTRLVRANDEYPLLLPLREIVAATHGPQQVIADRYSSLEGAQLVAIFGSWAARLAGEAGPMPNDIDVLVVGDVDEMEVDLIAVEASREIGREINPVVVSARRWDVAVDGFVSELRSRPLVALRGQV